MSVPALLKSLADQGVELWVEGNRLRYRAPKGALSAEDRQAIVSRRADVIAQLRADAKARSTTHPLSYSQQSLWFMHRYEPESAAYNVAFAARVVSTVDVSALRLALQALIDRHATLRTSYPLVDGTPVQRIAGSAELEFECHDAASLSDDALQGRVAADYARPFDLENGRVFRAALYTRAATDHVLLLVVHHIAADGWSILQLIEELRGLYVEASGGPADTSTRPETTYTDFTRWQSDMLAGPEGQRLADGWRQILAPPRAQIELPADRRRPATRPSRGGSYAFEIDAALSQRIRGFAREEGTTLFVVLLSAFKTLLFRHTGTEDVIVGTPTFGRSRPEFARVIGDFVNTIALRTEVGDALRFRDLIARVKQTLLRALDAQDYPFPLLVEQLQPVRDAGRTPLFDTFFIVQRFDQLRELDPVLVGGPTPAVIDFGALKLTHYPLEQQEGQFDLTLQVVDRAGALALQFKYNPDLFEASTVERLAGRFTTLIDAAVADPDAAIGRLAILTAAERRQVLQDFNATELPVEPVNVMRRVEAQVARTPASPAVTFDGQTLTYEQLNARANRIAHHLRAAGVAPGVFVGLCMPRSLDLVAAILAIQKAGGAHVPLDPSFPADRLAYMVADSAAPVVVSAGDATTGVSFPAGVRLIDLEGEAEAIARQPASDLVVEWRAEDPAYVLYTSGSTGRPKGVVVPQGAFVNFFAAMERAPGLAASDVLAAVTTISFDIAELEVILPLLVGARIELVSREVASDGEALARTLERSGATLLQATPATWRMLVESGWRGGRHIRGITGGEPLSRELADALLDRLSELWNQYGPTETTVYSTQEHVRPGTEPISIGRPVANTQIYILDAAGQPVPIGVSGEIWIGGTGVASGYHGRPDLTAERFVADPFSSAPGARMYRTGDIGRWRPDGRIEHFGRLDHQIKIRGYRIELGEIESVLGTHAAVRHVVVAAREAKPGDLRLVAYVVCHAGEHLSTAEMRRHLLSTLPDYMVPTVMIEVDTIPLTPSGKVDRKALPDPFADGTAAGASEVYEAPATAAEIRLAAIWSEVLRVARVGRDDDFFALGGHSLLATQVAGRIRREYGDGFALRTLFERPRLRDLAAAVEREQSAEAPGALTIPRLADGPAPLSFTQERMWVLQQIAPESSAYNVPAALRLSGPLDEHALMRACEAVIRRHEILRTVYRQSDGTVVQEVMPSARADWSSDDLRTLGAAAVDEAMQRAEREAQRPFDLARGPVLRARLWRVADDQHILLLCQHHISSDQWALGVVARDLAHAYNALRRDEEPQWSEEAPRFRDVAAWQRTRFAGKALESQIDYWRHQLSGVSPLQLPTDRPHPALYSFRGKSIVVPLPPDLLSELDRVARARGGTLFMVLFTGFVAWLHKLTGQDDIAVGVPIANRHVLALETVVGPLINTLVFRTRCSRDLTLADLVDRVRETALAAYAHQDVPFEQLVDLVQPERDPGRPLLTQVLFNVQNAPGAGPLFDRLAWEAAPIERHAAQFELTFNIETTRLKTLVIEYSDDLFDEATIGRLATQFLVVLRALTATPAVTLGGLSMLTADERRLVLDEFNRTALPVEPVSVMRRIEAQVARTPDAPALTVAGRTVSYSELNARANQIAHLLQAEGVAPGVLVGLCLPRSHDLVAAVLAIQKAGGAHVPLDPAFPADRLAYMVSDSAAPIVVTAAGAIDSVPLPSGVRLIDLDREHAVLREQPTTNVVAEWRAQDPAYVLYTSGSTGRPKGVVIPQGAFVNFFASMERLPGLQASDVLAAVTTISFDIAELEVILPLLVGARIELLSREVASDGEALTRALEQCGATMLQATPATWRMLVDSGWQGGSHIRGITGGEPLSRDLADALLVRLGELWNQYGPTETTVYSTQELVRPGAEPISIGRPVGNTQIYVLDPGGEPVPIGVSGEIWIGGAGVASGYHGRPDLTAERFVADRFSSLPGARLYRTGDVGRWRADGRLQHFGRLDHQVKIRGYRIELGEIESVLSTHPAVRQCVVAAREVKPGDVRLAAYVVCHGGESLTTADMRRHLQRTLPDYMVPTVAVAVATIPLTPSGKVDRKALPDPFADDVTVLAGAVYEAPATATEERLAAIWSEVLKVARVGRDDDFFALGGHSLLATQVAARIRREYGEGFALRTLFERPRLRDLANAIDAGVRRGEATIAIPRLADDAPAPPSFTQERMWVLRQLAPESSAYNVPVALRLRGHVDESAVGRALALVVARHDILRTTYSFGDGGIVQHVSTSNDLDWRSDDVRSAGGWDAAMALAEDAASAPFDLEHGPMLRARLWRTADQEYLLLLCMHHIASDLWSLGIVGNDFATAYNALCASTLPQWQPVTTRFRDVAAWQRQWLHGERLAQQVAFWRDRLAGAPSLQLPTDRPHPSLFSFRGRSQVVPFPRDLLAGIEAVGRAHGTTPFMTLFAGFVLLLHKLSGQDDVVVAVPVANRHAVVLEDVVGPMINTLAFRARCRDDNTFEQVLTDVRETSIAAFANQDVPFEQLVEALRLEHAPGRPVLAQVFFTVQNTPPTVAEFKGLGWEPVPLERRGAQFELSFTIDTVRLGGLVIEYSDELFDAATIQRFARQFFAVLRSVVADQTAPVAQVSILDGEERRQILEAFNATDLAVDQASVAVRFERQAAATPDALAVTFEGQSLTYAELDRRANRLARRLRMLGVGPGQLVGLCVERSLDLVVAVLGIQKSGGAYVPLDPAFPADRLSYMLDDSTATALVVSGDAAAGVEIPATVHVIDIDAERDSLAHIDDGPLLHEVGPQDPVYVIYTSGSTGRPKGVAVSHGALTNFLCSMQREPGFRATDVIAAVTTISFDIAGLELYLPLITGARIELIARETAADGPALAAQLEASGATVLQATPATWRLLIDAAWRPTRAFTALCGGEPLPREVADALLDRVDELWNLYGPTETTVWSTVDRVDGGPITVGRPIANTQIYVLDERGEPVAMGVAGEICIGGDGVAIGYHHRPELTAEKFVPDRFSRQPGARLYRTGDLGRWRNDGRLEHLGRRDHQVKVRGFRIELGEIEAVLATHEAIRQCVVMAREAGAGDHRLVAYVVYAPGQDLTASDVRRHLRQTLPDYMIPSIVVAVDTIPLTPNGKVDRAALPDPFKDAKRSSAEQFEPPSPGIEQALAEIWREILKVDRVGAEDNFFELGGHSLLSFRVAAEVEKRIGWRMDPRTLFFQTLRQIAGACEAAQAAAAQGR